MNLKPCPFCGEELVFSLGGTIPFTFGQHKHPENKCFLSNRFILTEEHELKAWNTRATDPLFEEMAAALEEAKQSLLKISSFAGEHESLRNTASVRWYARRRAAVAGQALQRWEECK